MNPRDMLASALERLTQHLRDVPNLHPRVRGIAELHRSYWPEARLCACLLRSEEASQCVVLDGTGQPDAAWSERLDPSNFSPESDLAAAWADRLKVKDQPAIVQPIPGDKITHGCLAVVLPPSSDSKGKTLAASFLQAMAGELGMALTLEALRKENGELRQTIAGLEHLACLGELASPLAHEFANFLNVLLLQVAVLQHQIPEKHAADLIEIRRQGALAAQTVTSFYQYRQNRPSLSSAVPLNQLIRDLTVELEQEPPGSYRVALVASETGTTDEEFTISLILNLCENQPKVQAIETDLRRLLRFLITNAVRAAANEGRTVLVTTRCVGDQVTLKVEDTGPTPGPDLLVRIFDPSQRNREGVDALEIAASRSIARRLGTCLQAEARREGGLSLSVEFASEIAE